MFFFYNSDVVFSYKNHHLVVKHVINTKNPDFEIGENRQVVCGIFIEILAPNLAKKCVFEKICATTFFKKSDLETRFGLIKIFFE